MMTYVPCTNVDLVVFAKFYFSRISRGGQICEFPNLIPYYYYERYLSSESIIREF